MSTHVTVAVAKPNHLPVKIYVEHRNGAQWLPSETKIVPVGGAETILVHGTQRLVIEEQE